MISACLAISLPVADTSWWLLPSISYSFSILKNNFVCVRNLLLSICTYSCYLDLFSVSQSINYAKLKTACYGFFANYFQVTYNFLTWTVIHKTIFITLRGSLMQNSRLKKNVKCKIVFWNDWLCENLEILLEEQLHCPLNFCTSFIDHDKFPGHRAMRKNPI